MDGPVVVGSQMADGIRPAMVDRRFLHSNSTSHEWMFGAIAELIDNACDPDVNANQFWIDVQTVNETTCLTFMDNGAGMDTETLHRMLSFGFSDKQEGNGHLPIGRYGNGFKSGSMRLGQDALVFTRQHKKTMSVGFLSQTYLDKIDSQTVVVPIVTWDVATRAIIYPDSNSKPSLEAILEHSIFKTEEELLDQLTEIPIRGSSQSGTRIFIYNLAHDERGNLELDFTSDIDDIRIPQTHLENNRNIDKTESAVSLYRVSLRKYVSILYLKPRMQIFLRGKKVKSLCLSKLLTNKRQSTYTPKSFSLAKPIRILFGQNPNEDEHGIMMFNRNRLIQAFRKNTIRKQNDGNPDMNNMRELMEVVIGVVELNCLTPNHIKQGFQDDNKFRSVEQVLTKRLESYCGDMLEEYNEMKNSSDPKKKEKDLWVQCDNAECQRWRRLPYGTRANSLPEKWFCRMNPDPIRNVCGAPEEPEKDPEMQKPRGKPKRRQSKATTESQPSTSELAATPTPSSATSVPWVPPVAPSPNMERVLTMLNEHCNQNGQAPAPGATVRNLHRNLPLTPPNPPSGVTANSVRRQLQPAVPVTVGAMSSPQAKRLRPTHTNTSVQHANEQEVIVLDDDEGESTGTTSRSNLSGLKIEPMEVLEVEPSDSGNDSSVVVKSETSASVVVEEVESSTSNTHHNCIKPEPPSQPPGVVNRPDPTSDLPSRRNVNALLEELSDLRERVAAQDVIQTRLESNIRDLLAENQEKDIRIQELEQQQLLSQSDSQDDVIVIEEHRNVASDSAALKSLRLKVQRYMQHLIPHYEIPADPQELEQDFAKLLKVPNVKRE